MEAGQSCCSPAGETLTYISFFFLFFLFKPVSPLTQVAGDFWALGTLDQALAQ